MHVAVLGLISEEYIPRNTFIFSLTTQVIIIYISFEKFKPMKKTEWNVPNDELDFKSQEH